MDCDYTSPGGTPLERLAKQQAGNHPAPCARSCEANAYEIEVRRLNAELERERMRLAARAEAALAEPQPGADGWINPNDNTRKQYLPHIGEKVLFCHAGVTYYGKHTGGSFQSFNPPRTFGTWDCLWMYPPKAREAQP